MTLIETMLALVIATLFFVMGLRLYQSFRLDQEARQLRANVEMLFGALNNYYRANCSMYRTSTSTVTRPASLDPTKQPAPADQIRLTVQTDLVAPGYLKPGLWPFPDNIFIDKPRMDNGFVVQFNRVADQPRVIALSNNQNRAIGKINLWQAQVALSFGSNTRAQAFRGMLGADCVSVLNGDTVTPCSSSPNIGTFLVWDRLPTFVAPQSMSENWPMASVVTQFGQLYSSYPASVLSIDDNIESGQYYLCGG
jgi:type II secretory pathway pseudopilin PulG